MFSLHLSDQDRKELREGVEFLREITSLLKQLVVSIVRPASRVFIEQLGGRFMITGVQVGSTGKFSATFNGALQAGAIPKWSTGDTSVTLTPAVDGLTCDAAVAASETLPSFGLSVAGIASDGNTVQTTVSVPVLPATPPPPPPATAVTIDQVS
jgi:hypothetical protein